MDKIIVDLSYQYTYKWLFKIELGWDTLKRIFHYPTAGEIGLTVFVMVFIFHYPEVIGLIT